jgi:hypothetical protein
MNSNTVWPETLIAEPVKKLMSLLLSLLAVLRVKNGNALEEEFIGRVIVDDPHSAQPRLEYFKVWIVSQSLLHAST